MGQNGGSTSDALDTFIEFKVGSYNLFGIYTKSLWLD